ncbi:MAG: DoxX family protein [bacterium]
MDSPESWAALCLRVACGVVFVAHGLPILTGREQRGVTRERLRGAIEAMGFPFPPLLTYAVGVVELLGGFLLLVGLASAWTAGVLAAVMVVATFWLQKKEGFALGSDFPFTLLLVLLALVFLGDGRFSLMGLAGWQ